jgi:putative MFS transporter
LSENVVRRLEGVSFKSQAIVLLLVVAALAQIFDGMDSFLTGYALPGMGREFNFPNPLYGGLVLSLTLVGMLIGSLVWSAWSDRIGRKPAFTWTVIIYSVGSLLSAVSPSYVFLLGARLFTGFGLGGEIPIANTLIAEYAPARHRGAVMSFIANMYSTGWFLASLAGLAVAVPFGWRMLYLVGFFPAIMSFFIRQYIPESTRFLLRKGDIDGANKVLDRMGAPPPSMDIAVKKEDVEVGTKPKFSELYSPTYRKRTVVLSTIFFFALFISFGFGTWLPSVLMGPPYNLPMQQSFTYALDTTLGTVFIGVSIFLIIDRLGRKTTGRIYFGLSTLAFLVFGLINPNLNVALFLVVGFITGGLANGGINSAIMWATELYPTRMRNAGEGQAMAWGRIGGVAAPLIAATLLTFFVNRYYFFVLFAVASAISAIMFFFGTETRRKVLETITH